MENKQTSELKTPVKNNKFIPTKDMWYVYFNFYTNTNGEISNFKKELKSLYTYILGFSENKSVIGSTKLLVYVPSEEDVKKIKNDETLKLYQKYVGENGFKVK